MPTHYRVVGAISLVVGGLAVLLQFVVTPLSGGELTGEQFVAEVTEHHTAMGWALALDPAVLLAAPAFLFIGHLARARTSMLASIATAMLFFPFIASIPAAFGLDGLAFLVGTEPNPEAMAHLVGSWQQSTWFTLSLVPYVLFQIVGSILMAIALFRVKSVPTWIVVTTGAWPVLGAVGQAAGAPAIGVVGYALLLATWVGCAVSLLRESAPAPALEPSSLAA